MGIVRELDNFIQNKDVELLTIPVDADHQKPVEFLQPVGRALIVGRESPSRTTQDHTTYIQIAGQHPCLSREQVRLVFDPVRTPGYIDSRVRLRIKSLGQNPTVIVSEDPPSLKAWVLRQNEEITLRDIRVTILMRTGDDKYMYLRMPGIEFGSLKDGRTTGTIGSQVGIDHTSRYRDAVNGKLTRGSQRR